MRRARLRRNVMQNNVTQTIESTATRPHRIETAADGERLIRHLADVLEALLGIVEEETELVRAGRISRAAKLETRKAELCGLYLGAAERLKANSAFLGANLPDKVDELRRRHDTFRALLQINLTVLATAHAVSEGIIRGVAGELTRKSAPQTYCPSGRPTAPAPDLASGGSLLRLQRQSGIGRDHGEARAGRPDNRAAELGRRGRGLFALS